MSIFRIELVINILYNSYITDMEKRYENFCPELL